MVTNKKLKDYIYLKIHGINTTEYFHCIYTVSLKNGRKKKSNFVQLTGFFKNFP